MTIVLVRPTAEELVQEAPRPIASLVRHRLPALPVVDVVDQWGEHSFPASDPPANW